MEMISTQRLAADTILDIGVPVKMRAPMFLRLLGKKTITLTIKQPFLGTCIRATRYYLLAQSNGIDAKTYTDALKVREKNAVYIAKAVATYICRGRIRGFLFTGIIAKWLINGVSEKTLLNITDAALTSGIEDFMTTIRLTASMNMLTPSLSPMEKRS